MTEKDIDFLERETIRAFGSREEYRAVLLRQREEARQKRQAKREAWARKQEEWAERQRKVDAQTILINNIEFDPIAYAYDQEKRRLGRI